MKSKIRHATWQAGLVLLLGVLASSAAWAALSVDDILKLKTAGVSETTILDLVNVEGATFDLSVDQIIALKEAGASEDFIRTLMQPPENSESGAAENEYASPNGEEPDTSASVATDLNDYSNVFDNQYYDPFAYYWYPWPGYYVYYAPFWWSRTGFYYGGSWCSDWWDPWGPSSWYCDSHYGYGHWFGPSHTHHFRDRDWHGMHSQFPIRTERERTIWQRAGLIRPAGLIARSDPAWSDAARVRTRAVSETARPRPVYRTETRTRPSRTVPSNAPPRPVYRDRGSARRTGDRGTQRGRTSEPERRNVVRPSDGGRGRGSGGSGGTERSGAGRGATPVRSGTGSARNSGERPGRGR